MIIQDGTDRFYDSHVVKDSKDYRLVGNRQRSQTDETEHEVLKLTKLRAGSRAGCAGQDTAKLR